MGGDSGLDEKLIQKIELEHTKKLLEEAGIDHIDALPEEKKLRWNAKRIGIAALVTATALGYYFISRPNLPIQLEKEIKASIYVLDNGDYAFYDHSQNGENIKIFSNGQLEYDLYDYNADGKVDELFSPPMLYVRRGAVLPPHTIKADILLDAADEMWKAIKENSQ